jgi:hypothetical protein
LEWDIFVSQQGHFNFKKRVSAKAASIPHEFPGQFGAPGFGVSVHRIPAGPSLIPKREFQDGLEFAAQLLVELLLGRWR